MARWTQEKTRHGFRLLFVGAKKLIGPSPRNGASVIETRYRDAPILIGFLRPSRGFASRV
jgi:hypothetical protein